MQMKIIEAVTVIYIHTHKRTHGFTQYCDLLQCFLAVKIFRWFDLKIYNNRQYLWVTLWFMFPEKYRQFVFSGLSTHLNYTCCVPLETEILKSNNMSPDLHSEHVVMPVLESREENFCCSTKLHTMLMERHGAAKHLIERHQEAQVWMEQTTV